ncbi:MAG: DUF58 domain-containing protein [Terriglobales bacterium]
MEGRPESLEAAASKRGENASSEGDGACADVRDRARAREDEAPRRRSPRPATPAEHQTRLAWRQSLGAGLLLGLALGCGWLAHWTLHLYPRLLLFVAAGVLALLGTGLMLTLPEEHGRFARWQEQWEETFSGAGVPFFTALVVLLVAAITSGNNLLYLVVSGLVAALIISGLSAALNLSGMELSFRMPEEVFAGRPARVHFQLTNAKSFWPAYSLRLSASAPPLLARPGIPAARLRPVYFGYLAHGAGASSASELAFPRRGRYRSAAFELSTRFPFGLMRKRRRFRSQRGEPELLVYPAPLPGLALSEQQMRAGRQRELPRRGDGEDLYRLRPHQPGDSARQVNWKASARAGTLYVRESAEQIGLRLRLRLALSPDLDPARAEAALSRCAGWIMALDGDRLSLEFAGENPTAGGCGLFLPLAPVRQQRRAVLEYLALVELERPLAPAAQGTAGLFELLVDGQS